MNRSRASGLIVVLVTCPSPKIGESIARALVEDRLAACVNVVSGLISIYRWQGKVCRDAESLLLIKTSRTKFSALSRRVKGLHPSAVPEIIALPIGVGSAPYLSWVRDSTA